MQHRLSTPDADCRLAAPRSSALREALLSVTASPYEDFRAFQKGVWGVLPELPPDLISTLIEFRSGPPRSPYLVISGLPLDPVLVATPTDPGSLRTLKKTYVTESCLTAVATLLGEVFSYAEEYGGAMIHSILPRVFGSEDWGAHFGSHELPFHTEIAWAPIRPSYVLLYCLREDHDRRAVTLVSSARDACDLLAPSELLQLRQPLFRLGAPESIRGQIPRSDWWSPKIPVLDGQLPHEELRINFRYLQAANPEAETAASDFQRALSAVSTPLQLLPGDLLVIDNRVAAHSRNRYSVRFDGRDRWLQQVYVQSDHWPARTGFSADWTVASLRTLLQPDRHESFSLTPTNV